MKKRVTKILRQVAQEKGTDDAHVKRLYKKLKRGWKESALNREYLKKKIKE
jgi:hypothetical protein